MNFVGLDLAFAPQVATVSATTNEWVGAKSRPGDVLIPVMGCTALAATISMFIARLTKTRQKKNALRREKIYETSFSRTSSQDS
ncbi:hypothetical protein TNCV_5063241 [Trichonephila clavipes]|nr:hypothetical protein TNCV_5063241 [Trichonephila clavipes]